METVRIFLFIWAVLSLAFGFFVFSRPLDVIDLQKKFYSLINWDINPISMQKEIRNTKAMGTFVIVFVMIVCLYVMLLN